MLLFYWPVLKKEKQRRIYNETDEFILNGPYAFLNIIYSGCYMEGSKDILSSLGLLYEKAQLPVSVLFLASY